MPGDACAIAVQFDPVVTGAFNATLKLESNDPDKSLVFIDVTGIGDLDVDGIHFSEEQAAPNGGDGNNDLVPDNIQNNIASFAAYSSGQYVTIIAPPGYLLEGVSGSSLSTASAETPQGVTFYNGLLEYSITIPLATSDNTIQMGVLLPSGDASTVYYNYGITADDPSPHWYDFSYDGLTGANYLGVVSIASPSGGSIQRKMYILNYVDGERGDDDLVVNGSVQAIGAVGELSSSGSGGSGAFSWYVILVGFVAIFVGRCRTIYFYKRVNG
jgi:hypothetical protein